MVVIDKFISISITLKIKDWNKKNALIKAKDNQALIAIDKDFAVTPNIEFGRYNFHTKYYLNT
jgi:hypothetical protein